MRVHIAIEIVALVAVVAAGAAFAGRFGLPAPLLLVVVGIAASYLPFVPRVELEPEVVLVGFLPPLLYSAAIKTSLVDFTRHRRSIGLLSVALVVFTAAGVGLVAYWLLGVMAEAQGHEPLPLWAAFAIGAVVAPPDAVAATAVAKRVGLPRRLVTILEGESLMNDATALVCLRTAIAAAAVAPTVLHVGLDFLRAAGGGVAVGLIVAIVLAKIRRRFTDPVLDTTLSLTAPFIAYIAAENHYVHASGVLSVVVAGLLLGHKAPVIQSAKSRISERTNWRTFQFLLENAVFLLIGLQTRWILDDLAESPLPGWLIALATVAVFVAVILLRPIWIIPSTFLSRRILGQSRPGPVSWQGLVVVSWAGMRGVVTLAAVFTLPEDTPHREVLVFIALTVTAGTLLVQGSTLPWLVRRLRLPGPDPAEDALQAAAVLQGAHRAAEERLAEILTPNDPPDVVALLRQRGDSRAQAAWERLGRPETEYETPSEAYRRLRMEMLSAERAHILKIRDDGLVADEVLQRAQYTLDIEESMLDRAEADDVGGQNEDLRIPPPPGGACKHLEDAPLVRIPNTPEGCEECLAEGGTWVHLRLCLGCGHVGCCDSSVMKHASKHYDSTHHPVMRSFEPGENWRWCFEDEKLG
ncbi:CPA1 family monovalent cation:H+ antiporter [Kribbella antiqua]|uniref:CPA1 family monovalent cation:H+ antiporter n=1 Tax=Kribbella antiqua TaxID=2512217 RepID=A0A4R2J404_9ACTN|nr:Na+/H+ antiporter [Kribbella antiqua]TCO51546.1 CPA1 family monovalent cation:H+ antiporter [Kribbella antiqua]